MAKKRAKPNQLYIISCGDLLKIGVTHDVEQRIKSLQTGNPVKLVVEHIEEKNEPEKIEAYLHRTFQTNRISGEWFEGLTVKDIRIQILLCHHID